MSIGFGSSYSINGFDEIFGYKFLPLSHFHFIEDGVLRFFHVMLEEVAMRDLVRLIMNQCLKFLNGSSNLGHYNSSYLSVS